MAAHIPLPYLQNIIFHATILNCTQTSERPEIPKSPRKETKDCSVVEINTDDIDANISINSKRNDMNVVWMKINGYFKDQKGEKQPSVFPKIDDHHLYMTIDIGKDCIISFNSDISQTCVEIFLSLKYDFTLVSKSI